MLRSTPIFRKRCYINKQKKRPVKIGFRIQFDRLIELKSRCIRCRGHLSCLIATTAEIRLKNELGGVMGVDNTPLVGIRRLQFSWDNKSN